MNPKLKAFLDTISFSEGTFGKGDDGYNVLVGGSLFHGYADHPRKLISIPAWKVKSTAAGRYQILKRYYDAYKKTLNLPDFSPASQDAIAVQMIKEQGAYAQLMDGNFTIAVGKCANIWASFPGAGYKQHEQNIEILKKFYIQQLNKYTPTGAA